VAGKPFRIGALGVEPSILKVGPIPPLTTAVRSNRMSQAQPRSGAQSRYEKIVRIVRYNTFESRPLIAREHVGVVASHANVPAEKVDHALQAAVRNKDLLRIQRHDGPTQYAEVTERSVQAVLANELARDQPAPTVVNGCRSLLEDLRGGR
jgi:hypothetical protein